MSSSINPNSTDALLIENYLPILSIPQGIKDIRKAFDSALPKEERQSARKNGLKRLAGIALIDLPSQLRKVANESGISKKEVLKNTAKRVLDIPLRRS